MTPATVTSQVVDEVGVPKLLEPIYFKQYKQEQLKKKIAANQKLIHEQVTATPSMIIPRTQARNVKQPCGSIEEIMTERAGKLGAQILAWRSVGSWRFRVEWVNKLTCGERIFRILLYPKLFSEIILLSLPSHSTVVLVL